MTLAPQNNARQNLRLKYSSALHFTKNADITAQEQDGQLFQAQTKNFSAHGLQIVCANSLVPGQKLKIYLNLEPYGIIPVDVVVKWTRIETSPEASPYWLRCGLNIDYSHGFESKRTILSYLKQRFLQAKIMLHAYA
ncbi:PilZ domain-containing protein [bacterium]|nr:PilZ domain-containing protein [bacterium]